jgi:hypothetical protein
LPPPGQYPSPPPPLQPVTQRPYHNRVRRDDTGLAERLLDLRKVRFGNVWVFLHETISYLQPKPSTHHVST